MAHVSERGWSGLPDGDWIPKAVEAGFVLVTGDRNEATRRYTADDLRRMRARVILLGRFFDHLGVWDKAKWWVTRIERVAAARRKPRKWKRGADGQT